MEKVIRICEMTGRVTTVAENLDTESAMKMIRDLSKDDVFGEYRRVVPSIMDEEDYLVEDEEE